jgi:hypothetical protein
MISSAVAVQMKGFGSRLWTWMNFFDRLDQLRD